MIKHNGTVSNRPYTQVSAFSLKNYAFTGLPWFCACVSRRCCDKQMYVC